MKIRLNRILSGFFIGRRPPFAPSIPDRRHWFDQQLTQLAATDQLTTAVTDDFSC